MDTQNIPTVIEERVLRRPEVVRASGLTRSALDREMRADRFPQPIKLSPAPNSRAVGWLNSDVQRWIAQRAAAARASAGVGGAP